MSSNFRLEPKDEFNHAATKEPTYNESFYANGWDLGKGVGGWMRVGNRVNEQHAEMSLVLYLPDGRIACQFGRPKITANDQFAANGLTLVANEPFKKATATYDGDVMIITDPSIMRDPKRMLSESPRVKASLNWEMTTTSPAHGGEPLTADQPTMYGRDFSLGHFNQHTRVKGALAIGDQKWDIDGFGWRDHSWGPRTWQAINFYRLMIANFGDDAGFMILKITDKKGLTRRVGVFMAEGQYEEIEDLDLFVDWTADREPAAVKLGIRTAKRRTIVEGRVRLLAPLRNRREINGEMVTSRIAEACTEFTWEGRKGLGICEFIEVLENGVPVGYPL